MKLTNCRTDQRLIRFEDLWYCVFYANVAWYFVKYFVSYWKYPSKLFKYEQILYVYISIVKKTTTSTTITAIGAATREAKTVTAAAATSTETTSMTTAIPTTTTVATTKYEQQ